jgi:WD40 repeat protein
MSSAVTTIDPSQTFSLQEGKQDEQQDALLMDDTHAYRLVKIGKDVLVYGGVDGLLVRASDQTTVRRWEDDALRAVAVSPNQRVVAIGLDEGDVQLYDFADYQASTTTIDDAGVHPFCQLPSVNADEDDAFLSQSDLLSSPHPKDKMRAGPRADSPVRQLLFLNDDFLAIASESGLTIVHLAKDGELPTFLTAAAKEAHQGSGVRGICWNAQENLLTSLAMDGRVCYWSCPLTKDPQSWKLWRKEEDMSVAKKDSGEYLGADPWDRSCCPWQAPAEGVLAIPGSNFWQLSVWNNSRDKDETNLDRTLLFQNEPVHTKTMVVIRSKGMQWLTTDRANAVVLWQLVRRTTRMLGQTNQRSFSHTLTNIYCRRESK